MDTVRSSPTDGRNLDHLYDSLQTFGTESHDIMREINIFYQKYMSSNQRTRFVLNLKIFEVSDDQRIGQTSTKAQ